MKTNENNIICNIIKIRESQGLTKREVAKALNINEASYGRLEAGKIALSYNHLALIASRFDMTIIDILTYPDKYVKKESTEAPPVEAILQIKLRNDTKDQVLKLVFGDNNIEILNNPK